MSGRAEAASIIIGCFAGMILVYALVPSSFVSLVMRRMRDRFHK